MKIALALVLQLVGNALFIVASASNPSQPLMHVWEPQATFNLAIVKIVMQGLARQ